MDDTDRLPFHAHPIRSVLTLAMAVTVGISIARFACALVLPDMRDDLAWSWSAAGFMNTINAIGYLGGALTASHMIRRIGWSAAIRGGTLACLASPLLGALSRPFFLNLLARSPQAHFSEFQGFLSDDPEIANLGEAFTSNARPLDPLPRQKQPWYNVVPSHWPRSGSICRFRQVQAGASWRFVADNAAAHYPFLLRLPSTEKFPRGTNSRLRIESTASNPWRGARHPRRSHGGGQ